MKIRKSIISALALILTCSAFSGCNKDVPKDEPDPGKPGNVQKPDKSKDDLESLVPDKINGVVSTGLSVLSPPNSAYVDYISNTLTFEHPTGTLFRFVDCPIFEYKLYSLENDKLVDTGLTTTFCMEDIINHFARELVFNNKGEMTISSCLNPLPSFELPVVKYKYSYKNGNISISPSQNQRVHRLIFNPVIITKRRFGSWGFDYDTFERKYSDLYIIAEENPYVIDFVNRLIDFLDKNGIPESEFSVYEAQREFCAIHPVVKPCRSFLFDVVLPFFYSMQGHSNQKEFNKEITTETLDDLKKDLESDSQLGQLSYSTGYRFVHE